MTRGREEWGESRMMETTGNVRQALVEEVPDDAEDAVESKYNVARQAFLTRRYADAAAGYQGLCAYYETAFSKTRGDLAEILYVESLRDLGEGQLELGRWENARKTLKKHILYCRRENSFFIRDSLASVTLLARLYLKIKKPRWSLAMTRIGIAAAAAWWGVDA